MSKKTVIFSTLTLFLPMLCGVLLWDRLPAQMATHFNINGTPDGYSNKAFTVFALPLFLAVVQLACVLAVSRDKKAQALNSKIKNIILWICPVISAAVFVCIYGLALGGGFNIGAIFTALIGLEFIIIGNYMPKCRQNNVIGIRVLWTLLNETVWNKFYEYKLSLACPKRFAGELRRFIDEKRYLPVCEVINAGGDFPLPRKSVISKTSSDKKRTVYTYPGDENTVLKLLTRMILRKYDRIFCRGLYSFRPGRTAKDAVRARTGTDLSIAVMNNATFKLLRSINAIKNRYLSTNGLALGYLTDNEIIAVLKDAAALNGVVVYDKQYRNESKVAAKFVPDGYVALLPEGALGATWYGTTPEEADLMGKTDAQVALVNTGVALTQIIDKHPVNVNTFASEIVLPSFERMDEFALLKVIA